MYVIVGATGNTGKDIALGLLAAGKKVRIVCRNQDKAQELIAQGAEPYIGDLMNPDFLATAFVNATTLYCLIPSSHIAPDVRQQQNDMADAIVQALQQSSIQHIVLLSSLGAHLPKGTGIVEGMYDVEQKFSTLEGRNVLFLRPTYFMENFYAAIPTIKQAKAVFSSIKADVRFPMVATKDIAAVALRRLLALDFAGTENVQNILGERDISYPEATQAVANAIGIPLQYVQVSRDEAKQGMMAAGLSESYATGLALLNESISNGVNTAGAHRTPETTTPTSIESFAQQFAAVYQRS